MEEDVVLCGASVYTKKFYINENFEELPQAIKDELKILCVLHTEEVGGTIQLIFDEEGSLRVQTDAKESDLLFDEIGAALKVKDYQIKKRELFESLETYFRVVVLGEGFEED